MQGQPTKTLSPGAQRNLAVRVATAILAVACVLAVLIARRTPEYEAQARVAYDPAGTGPLPSSLASGPGAATNLAAQALPDAQFAAWIDRYDLYAQARQRQSAGQLAERMRQRLKLDEPEPGIVQLTFRDADQATALAVTNAVAVYLAGYVTTVQVPSPGIDPPIARGKTPGRRASHAGVPVKVPPAIQAGTAMAASPSSANALLHMPPPRPDAGRMSALLQQQHRVDATLQDMGSSREELQAEQRQVDAKIAVLEKAERKPLVDARAAADGPRAERAMVEQDLSAEQAKLVALRDRYTEAYPDVQRTEEEIATLQARLERLPAGGKPVRQEPAPASAEQMAAMEKLRQERQRIERDLSANQSAIASGERRKAELGLEMQQAKPIQAAGVPAAVPLHAAAAAAATVAVPVATIPVAVSPFRLVESAGSAALVGTSRLALGLWVAAGTFVMLVLCFVPLVPAHYAAVVTTSEELQQGLPAHVTYLGEVGRTEL